jgi:amino acid adenylation domain-containing protein
MDLPSLIHQLFEQQVARTPSGLAVVCGDRNITYRELNHAANRLAERLQNLGVGPEIYVGVCLERSVEAATALLAILKTGGAYVYLDPSLPRKRLQELRIDSQPRLIVANGEFRNLAGEEFPYLDICSSEFEVEDSINVPSHVTPDNAAYLLYTSGSTGKPKGAVEIHRSLTARLNSGELPDIQQGDVCCLNSSFGVGITASRLFIPLALGAPVVILSDAEVKDADRFAQALETHGITSVFFSPLQLRAILALGPSVSARLTQLRAVTVTGSALTPQLAASFIGAFPNTQLVNVYGSTEIGTTATLQVIDKNSFSGRVSIGRPVPNTRVHLLDHHMAPVAAEANGEIYVSAPHLAREYLHQPELTAERFLTNPFEPHERLYRTGDLGRFLPNGEILLLGRLDYQVKVHGFRVELGEIEAVLEEHAKVCEAVVIAQPEPEGENRLIAYFVARTGVSVTAMELRTFLVSRLPGHMVPFALVPLIEMPMTNSGKVDREALPEFDLARADLASPYEEPRNPVEACLAGIWSNVLKVKTVGIHDYFLELGGDSLLATQAIVRVKERFEIVLTLESLFDQTLSEIAVQCNLRKTH